jgi:hypothetical protein
MSNGSWRVDERYVKVKERWIYLYRAVDCRGQTIDFLLSAKRAAEAAKRFFRKAFHGEPAQHHRGQERGLSKSHCGEEKGWQTLAQPNATTGEIPEQNRRTRSSKRGSGDTPWPGIWWRLDRPTSAGRLRGDGKDLEKGRFETSAATTSGPKLRSSPDYFRSQRNP